MPAALQAMRVLVNQAETGAVTLAFPQDVQAEAYDYPDELLREARLARPAAAARRRPSLARAVELIRDAKRPLIVAGGGVIYSEATDALRRLCEQTGIPVGETQAGKGSLPYDHPLVARRDRRDRHVRRQPVAAEADLVIGVGTRWSDFTTASKTAFRDPDVRFVNVNVADFDAAKHVGRRARRRRAGDARAARRAARRLAGRRRLPRAGRAPERGVGRGGRRGSTRSATARCPLRAR